MPGPVGLSVVELFRKVYDGLQQKLGGEEIIFPQPPRAEIADDSDYHRTRTGVMIYEAAFVAKVGNGDWLFAFGGGTAGYPADPYAAELLGTKIEAVEGETPDDRRLRLSETIEEAEYFSCAFLVGMADGRFAFSKYPYSTLAQELLGPLSEDYIVQNLEHRTDVLHMDLRPVVSHSMRYHESLVQVLVDTILAALNKPTLHDLSLSS